MLRETFSVLWLFPQEKVRPCQQMSSFPSCVGCCQRGPFLFCPIRKLSGKLDDWGGMRLKLREQQVRLSEGFCFQKDTDSINHITDSIKKPDHEGLWKSGLLISLSLAYRHPQHSTCLTYTIPHPVARYKCAILKVTRVSFSRWLVSTHRKMAQMCGPERDHKLQLQHSPLESKGRMLAP